MKIGDYVEYRANKSSTYQTPEWDGRVGVIVGNGLYAHEIGPNWMIQWFPVMCGGKFYEAAEKDLISRAVREPNLIVLDESLAPK